MGDLLGSLIWGAKSGQYCVIGGGSLHKFYSIEVLYHLVLESSITSQVRVMEGGEL
jgi:hypothetical protein